MVISKPEDWRNPGSTWLIRTERLTESRHFMHFAISKTVRPFFALTNSTAFNILLREYHRFPWSPRWPGHRQLLPRRLLHHELDLHEHIHGPDCRTHRGLRLLPAINSGSELISLKIFLELPYLHFSFNASCRRSPTLGAGRTVTETRNTISRVQTKTWSLVNAV